MAVALRDGIESWPGDERKPNAIAGAIASADVWTQSTARLDAIHQQHTTLCEDMEAAAVGRIAFLHGLPFLPVKDISNNEFLRASDLSDFSDFPVDEVGKRAAAIIAGLATELADVTC
jgi:nucleoside phosphorylase